MADRAAQDIQPRAQGALSASSVFALRELRVDRQGNRLIISGPVSSFYHKQLAQEMVLAVAEGMEVVNSISVYDSTNTNR